MVKKGSSSKKAPITTGGSQMSVTMREASTGKKRTNTKSWLKLQHIKNLAVWASHEAAIPSLAAFFGHHLAASSEALATPVDQSLFTCQRCESILHPGYNCTIRIEKNKKNVRHKGKKINHYPQNSIVYTCHFCSHRNMKRGTPRNTSQPNAKAHQKSKALPKVKTNPKSTNNQSTSNTVSSSDTTKDNVIANITSAPLQLTVDEPDRGNIRIVEISQSVMVKNGSADVTTAEAQLGSTADDPNVGKMDNNLEISETVKLKGDSADINTMAATLGSTEDFPGRCKMGIVEKSKTSNANSEDISLLYKKIAIADAGETLKVEDGSADINAIAASLGSTSDDTDSGKMGIVEISQMLELGEDFDNTNSITAPLGSTANDSENDGMSIVEISETLAVRDDFADINTAASPLGSTADDPKGKLGVLEISGTMEVKNDTPESCPATPLTRPTLTLLESKMGKRNRSGGKKKRASGSCFEAETNTSKRKRRKSWTSLKEIAKRDENEKLKRLMNVAVPFSL